MKKSIILLSVFGLLASGTAMAKVLSPAQAWQRASSVGELSTALSTEASDPAAAPELSMSYEEKGIPTLYVFSKGENQGFYVVSADDVAAPVLGYATSGSFDPQNIPVNLQGWLKSYSEQIAYASANGLRLSAAPVNPSYKSIEPITKSKWNQDAPYNDLCPKVNGASTYTGCVATAMAQVMKSYNYPSKGYGRITYDWNNSKLSFNFANTTFDWANMTDTYTSSSTSEQKKAVATLMQACGYGAKMQYGTQASGALGLNAAGAFAMYFLYDRSLKYCMRDYYNLPKWVEMLYNELSQGYPVYYDGQSVDGGHAFVIDGYNESDGFFHVNWGWGGMSNGYYCITTLDPGAQGIGGASAGFAYGQGAILNVRKRVNGATGSYVPNMYLTGGLFTPKKSFNRSSEGVTFLNDNENGIYSYAIVATQYEVGLKLVSSSGAESYIWTGSPQNLEPYYGWKKVEFASSKFPTSGTYTVTMVYRSNNVTYEALSPIYEVSSLKLTCSASSLNFEPIELNFNLKASDVTPKTAFYAQKRAVVTANISNEGDEYYGPLAFALLNSSTFSENAVIAAIEDMPILDLLKGESQQVVFDGNIVSVNSGTVQAGTYYGCVVTNDMKPISSLMQIKVESAPTQTAIASIRNVAFPGNDGGNGSYYNPYLTYSEPLRVSATVQCSRGYFDSRIRMWIFPAAGGTSLSYMDGNFYPVGAGTSATCSFEGNVTSLAQNTTYMVLFAYLNDNNQFVYFDQNDRYYFKIIDTSGIDDIVSDSPSCSLSPNPVSDIATIKASNAIVSAEIYSLGGACVQRVAFSGDNLSENMDVASLAQGHYVVKVNFTNGMSSTLRLMKK